MTSNRRSTFAERRAWIDAHPELKGATRLQIVEALKKAGLVAMSTYVMDVRIYQEKGRDTPDD